MTDTPPLKQCSKKEQCLHPERIGAGWLPATSQYFYKLKTGKNGQHAACKCCMNADAKARDVIKPENRKKARKTYADKNHDELNKYQREKARKNADQRKAYGHRYRADNPRKRQETTKKSYAKRAENNPEVFKAYTLNRRARKRNAAGAHTAADIRRQYDQQQGKCYYCDDDLHGKYHVDHVIPLSKGGTNFPDNLVCACARCNKSKSDSTPSQWLPRIGNTDLLAKVEQKVFSLQLP